MAIQLLNLAAGAELILSSMVKQLQLQGVKVPPKRYVPPAMLVAWDGPQITVALRGLEQGQPGRPNSMAMFPPQAVVYTATFIVLMLRHVAALQSEGLVQQMVPSAQQMDQDGQELVNDMAQLMLAGQALHQSYTLVSAGQGMVVGPCGPVGPQGGIAGNQLQLTMSVS